MSISGDGNGAVFMGLPKSFAVFVVVHWLSARDRKLECFSIACSESPLSFGLSALRVARVLCPLDVRAGAAGVVVVFVQI